MLERNVFSQYLHAYLSAGCLNRQNVGYIGATLTQRPIPPHSSLGSEMLLNVNLFDKDCGLFCRSVEFLNGARLERSLED
jgi:hypothetical protein